MIDHVLCDQDGVLSDFDGGVEAWYGFVFTHEEKKKWEYDYKAHGMKQATFWAGLTKEFWAGLNWTPEGVFIYEMIRQFDPVILTAPSWMASPESMPGKVEWIRSHIPEIYKDRRFAFSSRKHHFAHPGALLIDDKEENVINFREAGGRAIMVPRPWNKLHGVDVLLWVQTQLMQIMGDQY